jgi:drug/metabolite transporter (DMT)-like permease
MEHPSSEHAAEKARRLRPGPLAVAALSAFAANSLLCRGALGAGAIDAVSFTVIRIAAGAGMLSLFAPPGRLGAGKGGSWRGAFWLLLYGLPFSLAYTRLTAGTGALLLFGSVQVTMIGVAILRGERPSRREWLGLVGASGGLVYLVSPGLRAPDPLAAAGMILAGVGWAHYSLEGKRGGEPLRATAENFRRAAYLLAPWVVIGWAGRGGTGFSPHLTAQGLLLATASGALASALGYIAWYAVLRDLSATRAALVQLAVPVWTAIGAVALLDEAISWRLALSSIVILGSLGFAMAAPKPAPATGATREQPARRESG